MPVRSGRQVPSGRPRWIRMLAGLSFAFAAVGWLVVNEQRRRTRVAIRNTILRSPPTVRFQLERVWRWWTDRFTDPWGMYRVKVTGGATGDVLEIGVGRWPNLTRYGSVTRLVGIDADRRGTFGARRRIRRLRPTAEIVRAHAEALPFADHTFDTVVACLALCSVKDQAATLREVARVLRPGGTLRFLEHVRASHPTLALVQHILAPIWRISAGGCHPDRATLVALQQAGFTITTMEQTSGVWLLERPTYFGIAQPEAISDFPLSTR